MKCLFAFIALLALAGCASLPKVEPPDPTHLDREGQVRHFKGVTSDRVLVAAETVLRRHRPEGRLSRDGETLVMEYKSWGFYVVMAGYAEERWVIVAREVGDVTAASVAMGDASEGYVWPVSGLKGSEYPHEAGWRGAAVHVDYGMFWKRLESVLNGDTWPECEKVKYESGFRYFEPLCRHMTINRSKTD